MWLEPVAAGILFILSLMTNRSVEWPWMWVLDFVACAGAALSYRKPGLGAALTGVSLAVWLPLDMQTVSSSGLSFYINIFAAVRKDLHWKAPLILGLCGLAYLTLVKKAIAKPADQWTASALLLVILGIIYAAAVAYRAGTQRIQREKDSGAERLHQLQLSLARELHDSVAQTLSSAAMRANIVMLDPSISPSTRDQLVKISDECRSSAHDLRHLLSTLRSEPDEPPYARPLADVASLRLVCDEQAERLIGHGFEVAVEMKVDTLSAARCQTMSAIVVEATNNMIKHARPQSRCSMSITAAVDDVVATFSNASRTTAPAPDGLGIIGIQERLALLDGACSVERRDREWILRVRLPQGIDRGPSAAESIAEGTASPQGTASAIPAQPQRL